MAWPGTSGPPRSARWCWGSPSSSTSSSGDPDESRFAPADGPDVLDLRRDAVGVRVRVRSRDLPAFARDQRQPLVGPGPPGIRAADALLRNAGSPERARIAKKSIS